MISSFVHTLVSQPDCSDVLSINVTPQKQKEAEAVPAEAVQYPPRDSWMRKHQKNQYDARFKPFYPSEPCDAPQQETLSGGDLSPDWMTFDEGIDDDEHALLSPSFGSDSEIFYEFP